MTFKRTGYSFFGTGYGCSDILRGGNPATSRHTSHSLRLLPSRPDRVHELLLREDQAPIDSFSKRLASKSDWIIKHHSNHCKPFHPIFEQLLSKCLSFIQTTRKSQVNSPFTCICKVRVIYVLDIDVFVIFCTNDVVCHPRGA